jgi:multidrug efflux pump subunit AcrA (membrane-fusion protein)
LIPNINVDVRIDVRQSQNALVVPRGSVHLSGNDRFVYVVENGVLHQRPIRVGIASATEYEVVSGLKDGDTVAMAGDIVQRDGMQVNPVEIAPQ